MSKVAGQASESIVTKIAGVYKSAMAANRAHEINEAAREVADAKAGKVHGVIYHAVDGITDRVLDFANIACLGAPRIVLNAFDDKDSKVNRKDYRQAVKDGLLNAKSTVAEKTQYMLNDAVVHPEDHPRKENKRGKQVENLVTKAATSAVENMIEAE